VARKPNAPPIHAPTGTPNATAPVTPNATAATARPVRSGGASIAAVANSAGVAASAARIRSPIRTGNAGLSAAPTLAAGKRRRGDRGERGGDRDGHREHRHELPGRPLAHLKGNGRSRAARRR